MMTALPIIFIGPVRAGKTTLARLVADKLNLNHISLDDVRWKYYRELGYDEELARQIRLDGGFLAVMFYRQLFDPYSVERVLGEFSGTVLDFGAGIGPFENQEALKRVQSILEPIPNIFLLLPSQEFEESLAILRERDTDPPVDLKFDVNAHFIGHPGYRQLAKRIILTKGKTPEHSCAQVVESLS